jgi:hypothetical protein
MFVVPLFSRQGVPDELAADKNQLAQMVTLLGPPLPQLLTDSGSCTLVFFNEDGTAKGEVQNKTLELVLGSSLASGKMPFASEG